MDFEIYHQYFKLFNPIDQGILMEFLNDQSIKAIYTTNSQTSLKPMPDSVVFIKKKELENDPRNEFLFLNLPNEKELYSYLHYAITPYYVQDKDKQTIKKLAELELSLAQLQQTVNIPEIQLKFNPIIVELAEQKTPFAHLLQDSSFLNAIQKDVKIWINEIHKVTLLENEIIENTRNEIEFWIQMEKHLNMIDSQLNDEKVLLTLEILKQAKRFHATVGFIADTGIKEATEKVSKYNILFKEFPINELLSSTDLQKINESIIAIFSHLNKKIKLAPYPIQKTLLLLEALSRDLNNQLLLVLKQKNLMFLDIHEFKHTIDECKTIFDTWEEYIKEFYSIGREVIRKRVEKLIPVKVESYHQMLEERLDFIANFRIQHDQLSTTLKKISSEKHDLGISDSTELVLKALDHIKQIDILDLSDQGTISWQFAQQNYNSSIAQVESLIISNLKDLLGTCKTANDMFRIFSKFNALFVRPKIRGAIHEYQSQLIEKVKDDLKELHVKFMKRYENSQDAQLTRIRDLPSLSGHLMWIKMIERQLNELMKKVEYILGKGWEQYQEGQKLYNEQMAFLKQLDTTPLFNSWLKEEMNRAFIGGRIFTITKNRLLNRLELGINFDSKSISVFKEVRNLMNMGYSVPIQIQNVALDSKKVYPFAVSLNESLRIYQKCLISVEKVGILVGEYHLKVQTLIQKGIQLQWDYFINTYEQNNQGRYVQFVTEFSTAVFQFQDKINLALTKTNEIDSLILELEDCKYDQLVLSVIVDKIQKNVDLLAFESFSNLNEWVVGLDSKIEAVLLNRLSQAVKNWNLGNIEFEEQLVYTIQMRNQTIYLNPPLESAKAMWTRKFQSVLSVVTLLPRIKIFSFEKQTQKTFNLVSKLDPKDLVKAFEHIDSLYNDLSLYVDKWLQYQSLWDLEPQTVFDTLSDNLDKWSNTLLDVKRVRSTFDTSETRQEFKGLIVDYGNVQQKVNVQYDTWQRDLINKFSSILGQKMQQFYAELKNYRESLEKNLAYATTHDLVSFLLLIQELSNESASFDQKMKQFYSGQRILERQRYKFPPDWLYYDQINGEHSAFKEILERKTRLIQDQIEPLKEKIIQEDQTTNDQIATLLEDWNNLKPLGDQDPSAALKTLKEFEQKFTSTNKTFEILSKAKKALEIKAFTSSSLAPAIAEHFDLKKVWENLELVWNQVLSIQEVSWFSEECWQVKGMIEKILENMKSMPNQLRQYLAFQSMQQKINGLLSKHLRMLPLKSESLRERHWLRINSILSIEKTNSLKVGTLWQVNFEKKEKQVEEIISLAQGEMALEEYLKQIKAVWSQYSLEFTNFQNKCRLVKGWDELFTKCQDHLAALGAMKNSVHYKAFKDEAMLLEDNLSKILTLLDLWINVQRQWVYIQGIFSGNQEIKQILPLESNRFVSIDAEFMTMMRKVYKSPLIMEVILIPNIQQSMARLGELLSGIQRSLGDYLERERSNFSRFYFVADEDLLEILGNSKDLDRIQPHLKKIFPAISRVLTDEDTQNIIGVASPEAEIINFANPVNRANCRVYEWLTKIEDETRKALYSSFESSMKSHRKMNLEELEKWIDRYPAQILILASQCKWTESTELAIKSGKLKELLDQIADVIALLAQFVVMDLNFINRKKCESLITEMVHQRDVTRSLIQCNVSSLTDFAWLSNMRFYWMESKVEVRIASAAFTYGFDYLGVYDRLVQTPLTDRCYLTLAQALDNKLGGSPFGPAGTGKTESVKAMAAQLGRQCLVFCCDENFDFQSMGRIFIGLCKVGVWGCFDEFNRLEEKILSAVSQQIQSIQVGLKTSREIELVGKTLQVNQSTGVFITMNPGYAGRSSLPDNLTSLFRGISMTVPDRLLIAQVMLFSQGFVEAESLASKAIPFFEICSEQLSDQQHYDFGLRALKSVLVSAGRIQRNNRNSKEVNVVEEEVLVQSIKDTVFPKLIKEDAALAETLLRDIFSKAQINEISATRLSLELKECCKQLMLVPDEYWLEKVLQLHSIQEINHGVMVVGKSGTGKSAAWKTLLKALEKIEGKETHHYIIDPKAISKDKLYGWMDSTTREWTDGIFTKIIRKVLADDRGESAKRYWIVFDGDVDPEWVENLNSVLDDNKMLTLPNGERLPLPPNVRIMFEVQDLDQATPATVSRCGMVWFPESMITVNMLSNRYLKTLEHVPVDELPETPDIDLSKLKFSEISLSQRQIVELLKPLFAPGSILELSIEFAQTLSHVMEFTVIRGMQNLFSLLNSTIKSVLEYDSTHLDFPLLPEQLEGYILKSFYLHLGWSFGGDVNDTERSKLAEFLNRSGSVHIGTDGFSVFDYDIEIQSPEYVSWKSMVPVIEIDRQNITRQDIVVPTLDTLRHEKILYSWLSEHKSVILCGPPGSGKTMTLLSSLRKLPEIDVIPINFSSETNCETIIRTLEVNGQYKKSANGEVFIPKNPGRWLVLFCDEINLPKKDKYGTQKAISLIRQMIEQKGFWRSDRVWVTIERVQVIGACNPPTDPGRVVLSNRFLRHCPVVFVGYPEQSSLITIYSTFTRAALKAHPALRGYAEALTNAMVEFYSNSKLQFTADTHSHYIFSPRELTRWIRGIYEIIKSLEFISIEELVRIWAHEGIRLFQDRLVDESEKDWSDDLMQRTAVQNFPGVDIAVALAKPILFSNFISKDYESTESSALSDYIKARLQVFYEEEVDVQLVLFDNALEHILRIDRVFHQVQGHLLLIGISGSGKSTLTRFVAWMNGISVFQPAMHSKYSITDFDDDLRAVLKRSGCKGEKICFIIDEANVMDSSFLERINTLLANAEIPGLFEGDEFTSLMTACKEVSIREGLAIDNHDELYAWFTKQVAKNLHVIFTMNPPEGDLSNKATTSPALFNRCVLDWMGDWNSQAFYQVANEFTELIDLDQNFTCPGNFQPFYAGIVKPFTLRSVLLDACIFVHHCSKQVNHTLSVKKQKTHIFLTPRQYIDFVTNFCKIYQEKRSQLEDRQRHLIVGLERLRETLVKVGELGASLEEKKKELEIKTAQANEKLKKMVEDQQEAENNRAASVEIQKSLEAKNLQIAERKKIVVADLEKAEPAVIEAQQSVSNIKKQHLTEVRSMQNPPAVVKMTMEAVCILLGNKVDSWKSVIAVLRKDDFISSIVSYDTSKLPQKIRDEIASNYLNDPNFNFETVNRASKACGPLVQWVIAQVSFASILEKVEPLRAEVQQLEESANETKAKALEMENLIAKLENSINLYKDEYAVLISEVHNLKKEMEGVKERVGRSLSVVENLSSERERWTESRETFGLQMETLIGDSLIAAAFLSYAGYFDQTLRFQLIASWKSKLDESGIKYNEQLSIYAYLSTAEQRNNWVVNSLPADDLCMENAVILERSQRYPLIIDPSNQALAFLKSLYKTKNILITSFRDVSFLKNLESALRFGSPIIIQDAEDYDPILNPILNKQIWKSGGRNLCKLGKKEIDFSSTFMLFLVTKNPSIKFIPDICSRVTFVNFTVTPGSLTVQCLDKFLKSARPDIEKKRKDLLKAQGEFQLRLHVLEKELLASLNESKSNILDDDVVMNSLENLKKEASEILEKVSQTSQVLLDVDAVTSLYKPLAQKCSSLFFCIDQLHNLQFFYEFSLEFFFEIVDGILNSASIPKDRLDTLERKIFANVYEYVSFALRQEDLPVFALLISRIKSENGIKNDEWEYLTTGHDLVHSKYDTEVEKLIGHKLATRIDQLSNISVFDKLPGDIIQNIDIWMNLLGEKSPEIDMLSVLSSTAFGNDCLTLGLCNPFQRLLMTHCLRPDRFAESVNVFLKSIFDNSFTLDNSDKKLSTLLEEKPHKGDRIKPTILFNYKGYDVSHKVEALASTEGKHLISVAMGSAESVQSADSAIAQAIKQGSWVLVRNAHLSLHWLGTLEKKVVLNQAPQFKLFITCEVHPGISVNLLRSSNIMIFEPPAGVRSCIRDSLGSISQKHLQGPVEKQRALFMLSWVHAVILERTRYLPIGWTKNYDFNDSDFDIAVKILDTWFAFASNGRSNIAPETIPWEALRKLLSQNVYGGKIDRSVDQKMLETLLDQFMHPNIFNTDFKLVEGLNGEAILVTPDGVKINEFMNWVSTLQETQPPNWIGLSQDADLLLKQKKTQEVLHKLRTLDGILENSFANKEDMQWRTTLKSKIVGWLELIPNVIGTFRSDVKDSVSRYFRNEFNSAKKLHQTISSDLELLLQVLNGSIPTHWLTYDSPFKSLQGFLNEVSLKFKQSIEIAKAGNPIDFKIWIGGLFDPRAFLTATRQYTSKVSGISLENLHLNCGFEKKPDCAAFEIINLKMEGADLVNGKLQLKEEVNQFSLGSLFIYWSSSTSNGDVSIPVYTNSLRQRVLFDLKINHPQAYDIIKRSVAVIA
ncbi:hypothetical protein HK103_006909 [Boothiomyces macroporosus]|uniref:Dynein heavy chain, cytoplasmic n=1 Tax=Boothiomyces macroporosus TaxID=261099 RepID=A0AAD5UN24_9FUNG|nr:hypothetical protein HK103_006909 [Boothiomyces macroporosus]